MLVLLPKEKGNGVWVGSWEVLPGSFSQHLFSSWYSLHTLDMGDTALKSTFSLYVRNSLGSGTGGNINSIVQLVISSRTYTDVNCQKDNGQANQMYKEVIEP